jgi:acetamidase/formamidase
VFSDSDDIRNVDLTKVHNLTGPIAVEGAEPGDCLVVDILDGKRCPLLEHLEVTMMR